MRFQYGSFADPGPDPGFFITLKVFFSISFPFSSFLFLNALSEVPVRVRYRRYLVRYRTYFTNVLLQKISKIVKKCTYLTKLLKISFFLPILLRLDPDTQS